MWEAEERRVIAIVGAVALLSATVAVTASIVSSLTFLSLRLLFASLTASSLVAVVFLISLEKQATMHMGLHSYDLFFYLNASTLAFLWSDYRPYVVAVLAALAAATILAALTWRFDTTRPSRLASGLSLIAAIAVAGAFEPQASAQGGAFRLFTQDDSFVSAFYLSWGETWDTLLRRQLME